MIIRICLVICAIFIPTSMGKMDIIQFAQKFEANCFQNDVNEPFHVNGQERPLSNTMDNFIAMAEKFEAANPGIELKDELTYFISEFLFENIKIASGRISQRSEDRAKFKSIEALWDSDENSAYKPQFNSPFTAPELCSLYFMISHSILDKDVVLAAKSFGVSYGNFSSDRMYNDEDPDNYYPQEIGVVQVRGTDGAVSLSRVLFGLLVGLKEINARKSDLRSFTRNFEPSKSPEILDKTVDALYMVTMAEVLMLSSWEGSERQGMAENGEWVSIPLKKGDSTEGFCPMVNKQHLTSEQKSLPAYSYSSVRGAADGLIMGLAIRQILSSDTKLSQVLRMYYSPRGIVVENNIEDINTKSVTFCNRDSLMKDLEPKVEEQMTLYGYIVAIGENDVTNSFARSKPLYQKNRNMIYANRMNGFCYQPTTLDKPEELPAETFLDIIVVMDTSNNERNFFDQQQIIGYLARQLDLMYSGSRMTILLDRENKTAKVSSGTIALEYVVNDTFSSSCAACFVAQIPEVFNDNSVFIPSTLPRENVIVAVDQLLYDRKVNETEKNGANGKVVIFFNYENGDARTNNNRVQGGVDNALIKMNLRHEDVLVYAVGLDQELLKKYARNDPSRVFLGTDDKPAEVADKILKELAFAPTLLQYKDCEVARSEKSATYESFVSPNKLQHYRMPAEYFYKTFNAKFVFESQNGLVRVCYNRGTKKPEQEIKYCKDTTPTAGVEFFISNPCKSFTKESCSPLNFAVMGIDPTSDTNGNQAQKQRASCKTNDRMCSTTDQIRFKVTHEGIRCSGCLGLNAPPAVILFSLLIAYILFKRF